MSLERLRLKGFRCLADQDLSLGHRNLVYGPNAAGKTSLLEAIFMLGRGRSFRAARREAVIADEAAEAVVSGEVSRGESVARLGISVDRSRATRIRVNGRDETSAASLAEWLPVQVIDPDVHSLVEDGPGGRRQFLDWGVFHVEHGFLDAWRRYHRAMKQRNAALRGRRRRVLAAWDEQLEEAGRSVTEARTRYLAALADHVGPLAGELLEVDVALEYRPGWPEGATLAEALASSRDRDLRLGVTHVGPHRADVAVRVRARKARGRVSRGQQKLLAASLLLGQVAHLAQVRGIRSVLLIDEVASELDRGRLDALMTIVGRLDTQLFVTALEADVIRLSGPVSRFHVERGKLHSVV